MFASYEHDEANIATTAGFPGVYPRAAVGNDAATCGLSTTERNNADAGIQSAGEKVSSQFANAVGNAEDAVKESNAVCGNGHGNAGVNEPGTDTAGLRGAGERFEEVTAVETVYAGRDARNVGECDVIPNGESGEPFDPSSLPDEDYLDLLFVPLCKEERNRLSTGQTMQSLFEELLPGLPASAPGGPEPQACEQNEGECETVPVVISDDDYMDQMFAPLSPEDKARLSANQTQKSLFKELLGEMIVLEGPHACEERPNEGVPSKPQTGIADATQRPGLGMGHHEGQGANDVRMYSQVPTSMVCEPTPSQPQGGVSHDQGALQESAPASKVPRPQNLGNTSKPARRTKRKRTSRRTGAEAAQEGEQPRRQKRRRTRVEDMNPADVQVCNYEGCGKRFARRYNLTIHQRAHRNEYPFRCDVPNCGKPFMWHSSLSRHLRVHDKRRKLGGRKQRGKAAARAQDHPGQVQYPAAGAPPTDNRGEQRRGPSNVQALVSTVSFDQTLIALVGKKGAKTETGEVDVKAHLEDRWHQFAFRRQQIVGMWNSPITMSRQVFSRMCAEILNPDSMETDV